MGAVALVRNICSFIGLLLVIPTIVWPKFGLSAEIYVNTLKQIEINGELKPGDAALFQWIVDAVFTGMLEKSPNTTVFVRPNSLGGSIQEAMAIGRIVRKNGFWVATNGPGQRCASACVLVLAAGVYRIPGPNTVGIHRPTFPSDVFAKLTQQQAVTAYKAMVEGVKSYLADMDTSQELFDTMMKTKSDDINWISWDQILRYNLSGPTPAYTEWRLARDIENRKCMSEKFGAKAVAQHEFSQKSASQSFLRCVERLGIANGEACEEDADRRFPDPLKNLKCD